MSIDVESITFLRKKTRAGMQDCLRAFNEAQGNRDQAEELLKRWGLVGVESRAEREAKEGRVFASASDSAAAIVELLCETDFVALHEDFLAAGQSIADLVLASGSEASSSELERIVSGIASIFKENITLGRRVLLRRGEAERIDAYVHGDGRVGSLVRVRAEGETALEDPGVLALLHDLALHVAAFGPSFLDEASVPGSYRAEQEAEIRKALAEEPSSQGKSAALVEGIVAGKMRKRLAAACLLSQGFVREDKKPVAEVLRDFELRTGHALRVLDFACLKVGDA
jgi:elongation factor Ts